MRKNLIYLMLLTGTTLFSVVSVVSAQDDMFSIREYKDRVLEYSQQIKQSTEQRKAMLQAMKVAKTAFLPQVDASGNFQYRINDYNMGFGDFPLQMKNETYEAQVGIVQPIYNGGAIHNAYKAAQIQHQIATQGETLTTDNVLYSADVSYWSASAQKEMYDVMCQYVDIIQELADVLTDRFDDGLISKTELLQVLARLQEAELQKVNAYKSYQLSLQNLNVLMGNQPTEAIVVGDSISTYLSIPLYMEGDEVLMNRPEYHISNLNIDYQQRQINLTKSKYNPKFSIGFKETWGTQMLNITGTTMFNSTVYASVSIPILRWGARYKEVNAQKAVLRSQEFARQITQDQISKDVSSAWTNLTENTKQIKLAKSSVKIAEENLDLNTFSYNEGKLPILDVLSAQLTWIQSYSNLIQSWLQQKISLADYHKAVGIRAN